MTRFIPALVLGILVMAATAFAQTPPTVDLPPDQFLEQVFSAIKGFGGMSWMLKVSTIVMLLGATMKVSLLRGLIWDKLGGFKAVAGPVLGLLGGLFAYFGGGQAFSLPALVAYMFAGAGAIALHELLDMVKSIPRIGVGFVAAINFVESYLGGGTPPPPTPPPGPPAAA